MKTTDKGFDTKLIHAGDQADEFGSAVTPSCDFNLLLASFLILASRSVIWDELVLIQFSFLIFLFNNEAQIISVNQISGLFFNFTVETSTS